MYLDTEKCIQIQKIFVRKQSRKGEWKSFCSYLVVFSSEHLYSHDGKNEPENEADQKDVEDTGNGLHESIYNDLGQKEDGKIETFPSRDNSSGVILRYRINSITFEFPARFVRRYL